jgi:radical SAM family RiPP maturation amino acid epimerase
MEDIDNRVGAALSLLGPAIKRVYGRSATDDADYLDEVAGVKRFVECWSWDPSFREAFDQDPDAALAERGVMVDADALRPLWDPAGPEAVPPSRPFARFQASRTERELRTRLIRTASRAIADPIFAGWTARQAERLTDQLGAGHMERVGLYPVAFELQTGCSVGCWFCGVSAEKLTTVWPYTPDNAVLWQQILQVVHARIGPPAAYGFCYWASDPLDNPAYESFAEDFRMRFGRQPQMTTAIPLRDPEMTRRILDGALASRREVHRFSLLNRRILRDVHRCFSARDLLYVELEPRFSDNRAGLARAGRARARSARAGTGGDGPAERGTALATIACVSGFLLNLPERQLRLVSPCAPSDAWPDGYETLDAAHFDGAAGLDDLMGRMIERHMAGVAA